ncbi:MAG: hypothetical protein JNM88_00435 [Chitinophagaceae bacterium]|nr:hypothetical protein [Chitinophagaceae bacterium]
MRKHLLIILFLWFTTNQQSFSQTTDSTLSALLAIDETQYINKPLDSIIAVLPAGYVEMRVFGIRTTARFLGIKYPNKIWINLNVREFLTMNPDDTNKVWNVNQMRTEKLHSVSIHKGSACYSGCPVY